MAALINYLMAGSFGSSISLIHFSKQITPHNCQAYRMKVLSLTYSFSYLFFLISIFFLSGKQQKYKYKYTLIQLQLVNSITPNEKIKITYINKSMKIK